MAVWFRKRVDRAAGDRRVRVGGPRAVSGLIIGLGLVAAGCGGTTSLGNQVIETTTTIPTTTTTTIPPTTTTTIDFNRPVDQLDTPLPEEALISEMAEIVNDMRGQTDDLHQQITRLVDFPKMTSPIGSQVMDFTVSIVPVEDGLMTEALVSMRAPNGPNELAVYFDSELRSRGWNKADIFSETTETGSRVSTVFRVPGTSGDEQELTIVVDTMPGVVFVDFDHHSLIDDRDESYDLLQGWQDKVRHPSSADVVGAMISTADNVGTATVTHHLDAETPAEARSDMLNAVRSSEFETTAEADDEDSSPVTLIDVETGEEFLLEFAPTNEEDIIEVTVSATFPLEPLD